MSGEIEELAGITKAEIKRLKKRRKKRKRKTRK
jgi:hypothetical protein